MIIVENLPVPFDRRVWSEATTLVSAGYEVSVICPKGKGATASHEVIRGVHIYRHPLAAEANGALGYLIEYPLALFWEFVLSIRVLFERGFDVVHACNPPDLIFVIGGFYKLLGKKFVFDHHDICPELYEAKFEKRGLGWRVMKFLERCTFALADVSIATNQSYRKIAIERGRMAPKRVFVVRSGPDLERVRSVPPDISWKNGKANLVAYVGVIGKQEGVDLLLTSVAHIRRHRGNDVQFVIVGSGPELEALKAMSARMKLEGCVTFTGRIDDASLFSILSTADVCVNPDRPNAMNDKSTMNKIMEYMALGKPIVQYNLMEGRYSARNASLYARNTDPRDFAEKIMHLLDNPAQRQAMGRLGQKRIVEALSWEHEVPKLIAAYETLGLRGAPAQVGTLEAPGRRASARQAAG